MKFNIKKEVFLEGLNKVSKGISGKQTIPILEGVLIKVSENEITLTGSDSNLTIETTIPVDNETLVVEEIGAIVVPAKHFIQIIKALPQDVELSSEDEIHLHVQSGKAKFDIVGLDSGEYPKLDRKKEKKLFNLSSDVLKGIARKVGYAVAEEESRPVLTGVKWQVENGYLSAIATDSYRLAKLVTEQKFEFENELEKVVVPQHSLKELPSLFKKREVSISLLGENLTFDDGETFVMSRLLEGNYPETNRLIPTKFSTQITVNKTALVQSLDRARILAKDVQNKIVSLSYKKDGGMIEAIQIFQNRSQFGKFEDEITVDGVEGEELTISFNADYMIEALKAIDTETVILKFTGTLRPFVVTPVEDGKEIQLILPVRTY